MRTRRSFAGLLLACGVALALGLPAAAFGATPTKTAPEANGTLDMQTWPDSGQLIIVTAIVVPEAVKLPTTVRVPLVEGATVNWAGEVLGGDLTADPARPYTIKKSPVGGQYAEFTLEQTRSAQVDASMPALTVNGNTATAAFEWIQSVSSPFTSFSVRVPPDSSNVVVSPQPSSAPDVNASGETLFSGDPLTLAPGTRQKVTFSYTAGVAKPTAATGGTANTLIYVLIGALVVTLIALAVALSRQRDGAKGTAPVPQPTAPPRPKGSGSGRSTPAVEEPNQDEPDDDVWGFDVDE